MSVKVDVKRVVEDNSGLLGGQLGLDAEIQRLQRQVIYHPYVIYGATIMHQIHSIVVLRLLVY